MGQDSVRQIQQVDKDLPNLFSWRSTCNTYILRDGDAALLFDIGDGEVLKHLADLGISQVEWVVFTDHHRELCQGIESVNRATTRVAVPINEKEIFENPTSFRKWMPKLGDKYSVYGASYVRPNRLAIKVNKALRDGEIFKWGQWNIQCLETPGHSPGGMSFLIRKNNKTMLLTGGVIHDGAKMTNWFDSEWDYGFGKGLDALIASVDKLRKTSPDRILPAQGPVIDNAQTQDRKSVV